jgi:hypothetical protein
MSADESLGLSEDQWRSVMDNCYPHLALSRAQPGYTWKDLTTEQRKEGALWWLKHNRPEDVPLASIGITSRQADTLAANAVAAMQDVLPSLVKPLVAKAVTEALTAGFDLDQADVNVIAARVQDQLPGAREIAEVKHANVEMARELATLRSQVIAALTIKTGGQPAAATAELESLKASVKSLAHRADRMAEHLATHETKIQKLRSER